MAEIHDIIENLVERVVHLEKAVVLLIKFNMGLATYDEITEALKNATDTVRDETDRAVNSLFLAKKRGENVAR